MRFLSSVSLIECCKGVFLRASKCQAIHQVVVLPASRHARKALVPSGLLPYCPFRYDITGYCSNAVNMLSQHQVLLFFLATVTLARTNSTVARALTARGKSRILARTHQTKKVGQSHKHSSSGIS